MYRKQVEEVHTFDETKADHGYAETDPTGRYGRVSFSLLHRHTCSTYIFAVFFFVLILLHALTCTSYLDSHSIE